MDRALARRTPHALLALLLVAPACADQPTAPAPATPTQPPAVVVIPAASSTPEATPVATAEATAEPAGTRAPDPPPSPPARLDQWKTAVERYTPSVRLGNTTALNAARLPFASYLVAMHNRIHPVFAEQFLGTLGNLPPGHPLNQDLATHLEIVIDKDTGKIIRMGVTRTSGVTAFDVAALEAVSRAAPFGKAPDAIASVDGKVYLHWEFHRDPVDACTTRNARPYILKSVP